MLPWCGFGAEESCHKIGSAGPLSIRLVRRELLYLEELRLQLSQPAVILLKYYVDGNHAIGFYICVPSP